MTPMRSPVLVAAFVGTLLLGAGLGYRLSAVAPPAGGPLAASPLPAAAKPVYTCPMHPQVVSDHPGECPICHMDLVLKAPATVTAAAPAADDLDPGVRAVTLSPRQRVLANVTTAKVKREPLSRSLALTGRVAYDESRLTSLSAWIDGRIDFLAVKTTGATVARGALVARLYSPELVATQQEYLTAQASAREMATSPYPELLEGARALVAASRQRLRAMGVSDAQLRALDASGKPTLSFPIFAQSAGVVVERKVQQGQYVKAGDVLFSLADFGHVWVEADAFEPDLAGVKPGMAAEVRVAAAPDRVFSGRVSFVAPTLDPATRTGRVRVALANPGGLLKPEMYANVRLLTPLAGESTLSVPASAVMATGRRHVVYVEVAPNQFEPRTVEVGPPVGDRLPVRSGLEEGEAVAVSGGFLLDASTQLEGGAPAP